ncbi:MAG: hypothetical protein WAK82_44660 [Streptosporangiaceae bacterium]
MVAVVPIAEYQQLRQAADEQRVNEDFDAARTEYLTRQAAGTIRYVPHEEASCRLGLPSRQPARSTGRSLRWTRQQASSATIPLASPRYVRA